MKNIALILISLLIASSAFSQEGCNQSSPKLMPCFQHGQQTGDYDYWRQAANTALSNLVSAAQQGSNPSTVLIDIAEDNSLTTEQKLNRICDIFNGLSRDPNQTRNPTPFFRVDQDLKASMIVVCEKLRLLQDQIASFELSEKDSFHIVGDVLSGLGTTFINSWITDSKGPLKFIKDQNGTVFIQGLIHLTGSANGGITVMQLPIEYRPIDKFISDMAFDVVSGNVAQVFITSNGNMSVDHGGINPNLVLNFSFHP